MNFVLDADIRSFAPAPEAAAASPAPTPGGRAFADNYKALSNLADDMLNVNNEAAALFLAASPAPTPGGRAFADNYKALSNLADDMLNVNNEAAALFFPDVTSLAPQSVNAQPGDSIPADNNLALPYPYIMAAPKVKMETGEAAAPDGGLMPAVSEAARRELSHDNEEVAASVSAQTQAPPLQPEDAPPPENLLVPPPISEPLVRQALSLREPKPDLEQAATLDGARIELAPASDAASAPPPAAANTTPAPHERASLSAEAGTSASAVAILGAAEMASSPSQQPQPASATTLSIATAPTPLTASVPPVAAAPLAQAVLVALPSEIPDIVTRAIQDKPADRITVQLDPPELGRVSIDFRFEGQTLQHVTITAETPEAVRQLRLMHGELLEALEQNGLGQKDMTFQQQTPQERQEQAFAEAAEARPGSLLSALQPAILTIPSQPVLQPGRLDIRL